MDELCETCGIGYYLPSGVCDHCNSPRKHQCPLCHREMKASKDVIENIHIGRVHLSCILLHAITKPPGPLGPL